MSGGVSIKYNNNEIASMSSSGTKTLLTKGKYCNSDIQLDYEKPAPAVVPLHAYAAGTYTPPTGKGYGSVVYGPEGITDAVRFLDYDGTILHQYTASQFLALSSMPANPSHTGLTAQGWNWSLAEAQAYVSQWGFLDIGQMYVTSSGKTEVDMVLSNITLNLYIDLGISGEVQIEWGDGTTTNVTGTSLTTRYSTSHQYATKGNYTLKISAVSGTYCFRSAGNYTGFINSGGSNLASCAPFRGVVRNVRIGNNVPTIGQYALKYYYALKSVTLPNTVTSLESYSFYYLYCLRTIILPISITSLVSGVFLYCYNLRKLIFSSKVNSIATNAWSSCENLSTIIIPDQITSFTDSVVYNRDVLRKIIPCNSVVYNAGCTFTCSENLTTIRDYFFYFPNHFTSIELPSSITSIGTSAFQYCRNLSSIEIPSTVTSISHYAFNYCYDLESVNIPSSLTSLASTGYTFQYCYNLKNITFPQNQNLTTMPQYCFSSCYGLESVDLSNSSITSIGNSAFYNCYGVTSIILPNTLTSIGNSTFYNCQSLSSIEIPSSVTSIGNSAFNYCYGVAEYHIKATTPPTLGTKVFSEIASDCKIYVPSASLSTYQTATNWSTYASYMVGE